MNGFVAWIALAAAAGALVAVVAGVMRKPMQGLLTANRHMAPAAKFYGRAFVIVISLAALAAVVGTDVPCAQQAEEKAFMGWVWWTADGLEPVFWSLSGFLMGYVLLLTIVFGVLGRYRDE